MGLLMKIYWKEIIAANSTIIVLLLAMLAVNMAVEDSCNICASKNDYNEMLGACNYAFKREFRDSNDTLPALKNLGSFNFSYNNSEYAPND